MPLLIKNFDTTDGSVIYIAQAVPGTADSDALWQIIKVVIAGSVIKFRMADGNLNFDNSWDNRASVSYS
jgi:hypothetical protein